MQTFRTTNLRNDATVENLLAKIWIMVTGQAINKDTVDALFAFKNQSESWDPVVQVVNEYLQSRLAAHGGSERELMRELFTNAGVSYTGNTLLDQHIQLYKNLGSTDPLLMLVSALLDPATPHYQPLFALSRTQANTVLQGMGLGNYDPTGNLSVLGLAKQGEVLSVVNTLADADGIPASGAGAMKIQWLANGQAIAGATGNTYKLTQAEVGKAISLLATWTDNGGTQESKISTATAAVANVNDLPTGAVTITGAAQKGQTLSVTHTLADADGIPTSGPGAVKFQWLANGQAIAGATASTLTLGDAHVGKTISVAASYTDHFGAAESVTSAATTAVAQVQQVGRFDQVYWQTIDFFTGEKGSILPMRGKYQTFEEYRNEYEVNASANIYGPQEGVHYNPNRAWSFDGPVEFQNNASPILSSLPYTYQFVDPGFSGISDRAPSAPIFDFSGGGRTIVIDLAAKRDLGHHWMLFKDFGADDKIVFATTDPYSGPILGIPNEKGRYYSGSHVHNDIKDFLEFTDYQQFVANGQAAGEARYQNFFRPGVEGSDPTFEANGVNANVLYLKDAKVSYTDRAQDAWDNSPNQRHQFVNPEDIPATSVGLLLIDAFSYHSMEGFPHIYQYVGKGADGMPDVAIGFIGSRPESFSFGAADYMGYTV